MKKTINADDAPTALTDAIADLLHVHDGDEQALGEVQHECWKSARRHYQAEATHEDGVYVEVR